MHILEEWRFRDVEQKADRAINRLYELDSLRSTMDRLEHSNREFSAEITGLRSEVQTLQEKVVWLEAFIYEHMAKESK